MREMRVTADLTECEALLEAELIAAAMPVHCLLDVVNEYERVSCTPTTHMTEKASVVAGSCGGKKYHDVEGTDN